MADPVSDLDPYDFLNMKLNPDGSLTRYAPLPSAPTTTDSQLALSKDIQLNPTNATFLRLFRPASPPAAAKLPVIIYIHGGGFIVFRATSLPFHHSCAVMSAHTPALIISLEYRLAPEHRLPAQFDDAMEAVLWLQNQALSLTTNGSADEWVTELADFSKVYLMGSSSGGNVTYNAGLRVLEPGLDLDPIKIVGLIMNQPFFGGVERTPSELRLPYDDPVLPLPVSDLLWSLALPEGYDRDNKWSNPFNNPDIERIERLPKCMVRGFEGDPLIDRQRKFADMLEARGVHVTRRFFEGGYHGVDLFDLQGSYYGLPEFNDQYALVTNDDVKAFISSFHN